MFWFALDDLTRKLETYNIPCSWETVRTIFRLDRLRYIVVAERFQLNAKPGQRPQNAHVALPYTESRLYAVERTTSFLHSHWWSRPLSGIQFRRTERSMTRRNAVNYIIFHKGVSLNAQSFLSCLSTICS